MGRCRRGYSLRDRFFISLVINVYLDAAVSRVVFVGMRDAAAFGGDEGVGDGVVFFQERGDLLGALLGQVEIIGFAAFVVGIAGDEDAIDAFLFKETTALFEDGGVGELVAIEFEIDIGDAEGVDLLRGCFRFLRGWFRLYRFCYCLSVGIACGGYYPAWFWMTAMDGEEAVVGLLVEGTAAVLQWLEIDVGDPDIGGIDAAFAGKVGIGFFGKIADDEDLAVIGGRDILVQLEPAAAQFRDPGVHEADIVVGLEEGVAMAQDIVIGEPEADIVDVRANIGRGYFYFQVIPGAASQGAKEPGLHVYPGCLIAVEGEEVEVAVVECASMAGPVGKEPAGGAAGGVVFGAVVDGVEFAVRDEVLGGQAVTGEQADEYQD